MKGRELILAIVLFAIVTGALAAQQADTSVTADPNPTVNYNNDASGVYGQYLRTGQLHPPQPSQPTTAQLDNNLATYQGRPLDDAINNFGPPDAKQAIAGREVYIWVEHSTQEVPVPGIATTDGMVGNQPYSATTYGGGGMASMTAQCKLTMEVDDKQIVKHVWYAGNMAGCSEFMKPAVASLAPALKRMTFAEIVAKKQAANGNVPLTEQQLDDLKDQIWAQEEPGVWAQPNATKDSVQAEKDAFESGYAKWKAEYLKQYSVPTTSASSSNQ